MSSFKLSPTLMGFDVPVELVSGLGVRGAAFGANGGIYLNGHAMVAAALAEQRELRHG